MLLAVLNYHHRYLGQVMAPVTSNVTNLIFASSFSLRSIYSLMIVMGMNDPNVTNDYWQLFLLFSLTLFKFICLIYSLFLRYRISISNYKIISDRKCFLFLHYYIRDLCFFVFLLLFITLYLKYYNYLSFAQKSPPLTIVLPLPLSLHNNPHPNDFFSFNDFIWQRNCDTFLLYYLLFSQSLLLTYII